MLSFELSFIFRSELSFDYQLLSDVPFLCLPEKGVQKGNTRQQWVKVQLKSEIVMQGLIIFGTRERDFYTSWTNSSSNPVCVEKEKRKTKEIPLDMFPGLFSCKNIFSSPNKFPHTLAK